MEIPKNAGGNESSPSRSGSDWRLFLLFLLFLIPIPFNPWWVSIIGFGVFTLLAWLLQREKINSK
jgi:hypothetical protein